MKMKPPFLICLCLLTAFWCASHTASAAFTNAYAAANWTLVNSNADGWIDLSEAPDRVRLVGGNNGAASAGLTTWSISVPASSMISFDWNFSTLDDDSGPWDRGGWRKNTVFKELANDHSTNLSGQVSALVSAGDVFGFWVRTEDNLVYPGILSITNFIVSAAPPRFSSITVTGQVVTLRFETIPGRRYQIEAAAGLPASPWTQVGSDILAVDTVTSMTTNLAGSPRCFFRAVLMP